MVWLLAGRPGQAPEKLAEALRLAARATDIRPKDAGMWSTLGLARYRSAEARLAEGGAGQRTPAEGQEAPAEGQGLPPEGPPAETASSEWTAVIEALENSVDLGADGDPANWLLMAMARWRLGEKEEAMKCREQAVRSMKESGDAPEDLQLLFKEADALLGTVGGEEEKTSV
jgi:tetratricopeptide (TPR) repeat protein